MNIIRRLSLAALLALSLSPAFAQVAPPVPALPDTERRTSYSISASTCSCAVGFALFGDSTDVGNWIEVFVNGVRMAQAGNWTLSSVTGTIGSIPLPITNAVLIFTAPQTGTIQIVGARRPRRTSQFNEGAGVPTRNFNVVLSDLTAQNRELWDKTNDVTGRALISQPGNTISMLPLPSVCAGKFLGFDATGLIPQCSSGGAGSGNVVGPASSINGNVAVFNGTTGALLADSGTKPVTPLTCSTSNWFRTLSAAGTLGCSQPAASDISGLAPSATTDTTNASNITSGTLPSAQLPAGVQANVLNAKTANYTIATTDCGKTIQAGTGATGAFTITLPVVAGFASNCVVTVKNADTGRGKLLSGFPSDASPTLWPLQTIAVQIVNGVWATMYNPGIWTPTSAVTLFIDVTNGNDANDCLAAGSGNACATSVKAVALAAQWIYNYNGLTFQYANATYTNALFTSKQIAGPGTVTVQGNTATPASVNLHITSVGNCIICIQTTTGTYVVKGFFLDSTVGAGNGNGLYAAGAGVVVYYEAMTFGALAGGFHVSATSAGQISNSNGALLSNGNYSITGGAGVHAIASDGGQVHIVAGTITISGTPAFSASFLQTHGAGSIIGATPAKFSGAATGPRWNASLLSLIDTGAPTTLPGNSNGSPTANTLGTDGSFVD